MAESGRATAASRKAVWHILHPSPPSAPPAMGTQAMLRHGMAQKPAQNTRRKTTVCFKEDRARRKSTLEPEGEPGSREKQGLSTPRQHAVPALPLPGPSAQLAPASEGKFALRASCFSLCASRSLHGGKRACREGEREKEGREYQD